MDSTLDLLKRLSDQKDMGRPRDLQAVAELEAIRERLRDRRKTGNGP